MNRIEFPHTASLVVVAATLAWGGTAAAATQQMTNLVNAAGICQSALPVFDGQIRKRPLAIQNEGTSDAFVTCPMLLSYSGNLPTLARAFASSNDGAAHTVTCTAVTGFATGSNLASVKTITVPADGSQNSMAWQPSDFAGSTTQLPSAFISLSCRLPPGSGLNDTYLNFAAAVGA